MPLGKQALLSVLRASRLLGVAEAGRYWLGRRASHAANRRFRADHPGFALPPEALAYDAYGHTDWGAYYRSGAEHARAFAGLIRAYARTEPAQAPGPDSPDAAGAGGMAVCEWGCGPARILRQLGRELPGARLAGSDYNPATVRWCRENVSGVEFVENGLAPPLPFPDRAFDALYSFSVFTHLSREMHEAWLPELARVVKPGGILLLTTHGDHFRPKLLPAERRQYDRGELVVRSGVEEGKRAYIAFHPPRYLRETLLRGLEISAHLPGPTPFVQDVWVARVPSARAA